tara:strand:- start:2116 stop:2385 length:270 start_codon:yes stop_codon:yes gene_type:complete
MSEKNNTNEWKSRELGALWARKGKNQNYFSGYVTVGDLGFEKRIKIVGFKNNFKDNENQPDFRLYQSEAEAEASESSNNQAEGEDQDLI